MRRPSTFAFCGIALGALLACGGCARRVLPGHAAPDFRLTLANGQQVSLASFRGRVVVLNFWASYCLPCIQETPALNALAQEFPQGRVVVLGVSIDQDPVAYQTFLSRYHIRFDTALDPSAALMHRYGTQLIPETYIINPAGEVVRKLVSAADWTAPDMVTYLRRLADAAAPAPSS